MRRPGLRAGRAYSRAKRVRRVTARAADVLPVKVLGVHPVMVWGDDWLV